MIKYRKLLLFIYFIIDTNYELVYLHSLYNSFFSTSFHSSSIDFVDYLDLFNNSLLFFDRFVSNLRLLQAGGLHVWVFADEGSNASQELCTNTSPHKCEKSHAKVTAQFFGTQMKRYGKIPFPYLIVLICSTNMIVHFIFIKAS